MSVSTGPVLALRLDRRDPLRSQIEQQLRTLIRTEALALGAELPSTRGLATDLGVSRGVVVGAYTQLACEGYIALRRGAVPVVAAAGHLPEPVALEPDVPIADARFNLRPDLPDLGLFPHGEWLRACRSSLRRAAHTDLAYGEPFGAIRLRSGVAALLARTRGVVATPDRTGIFAGSSQALHVVGEVLRAHGARRIAVEDPGHRWRTRTIAASGLEVVPVPVDRDGLRVELLPDVDAVVVSPDHQFPTGSALSPERRRALVEWAAGGDRLVVEHDYDAHFRYDRMPTGALQGLAPEHVAYVGGASALLVPTLRIGWAVLPSRLVEDVASQVFVHTVATSRLTQLALAELIDRGHLDRHLRRARTAYRKRRSTLVEALARRLPDAAVEGEPAGLFVSLTLPDGVDEAKVADAARTRGIALDGVNEHTAARQRPGLVLGFAAEPPAALARAVEHLAAAVRG